MESPREAISRPSPDLTLVRGTANASVSKERLKASYIKPWEGFFESVSRVLETLGFDGEIKCLHEEDRYIIGSELGLAARFVKHVADPVAAALSVTRLRDVVFGDVQSLAPGSSLIPDITLLNVAQLNSIRAISVGKLKTWWTVSLEGSSIMGDPAVLLNLESHVGQVVSYMRALHLRFSFLSTYRATVFIRRVHDYRFELSTPILNSSREPSLRECFVAFCFMASENPHYLESSDFDPRILSGSSVGLQASLRPSEYRILSGQSSVFPPSISQHTIFIGDGHTAKAAANFVRFLHGDATSDKAVIEVEWGGNLCIAKTWRPEGEARFSAEAFVYEELCQRNDTGSRFPTLKAYGNIACSSVWPAGHILVLSKVPGDPLYTLLPQLHVAEIDHIRRECRKAVEIFREIGIWIGDCGPHNVFYCRGSCKVTMMDFEIVGACSEPLRRCMEAPELAAIFGGVG